jgi:hypothetical protein
MLIACISERAKRLDVPADLPVLRDRETLAQVLASTFAHPLPTKALRVELGQQPQRCFQSPTPCRTTGYGETLLEPCPVVAFLLRRQLWRGTAGHY